MYLCRQLTSKTINKIWFQIHTTKPEEFKITPNHLDAINRQLLFIMSPPLNCLIFFDFHSQRQIYIIHKISKTFCNGCRDEMQIEETKL